MTWSGVPEVATPRVMTQTLALLFLLGGVAGLLATLGSEPDASARGTMAALAGSAIVAAVVSFRWGTRWPRLVFHVAVLASSVIIVAAVSLSPDAATAVVIASLVGLIAINACYFFSLPLFAVHLLLALTSVTTALVLRDDVALPTALALDAAVLGLSSVTRGLVVRASSASRDPLTGLANRRGFDSALQGLMSTAARTGEPLSAALLDLDHFKAINDTQGHDAGDRVLRQVAQVWAKVLPPTAVLARHGGDEFALLLPGLPGPAALEFVRRVRASYPEIGMSCGVAEHRTGESAAQLMRRADLAPTPSSPPAGEAVASTRDLPPTWSPTSPPRWTPVR